MNRDHYYDNFELAIIIANCETKLELLKVKNQLNYLIRHGKKINAALCERMILRRETNLTK